MDLQLMHNSCISIPSNFDWKQITPPPVVAAAHVFFPQTEKLTTSNSQRETMLCRTSHSEAHYFRSAEKGPDSRSVSKTLFMSRSLFSVASCHMLML